MSKIDTQGMSGPVDPAYRGKDNIYPRDEKGNPIYPPFNPTPLPIFDTKERAELKEIMIEALKEFHGDSFDSREAPMWTLDEFQE